MESGVNGICHVAAIPYPGRGHINPMMILCRHLASRGLLVTVVVTEEWAGLLGSGPPNLRLRPIPNVLPSEGARGSDFGGFVQAVFSKMEGPVEALLECLEPPVDSMIADSLLTWAAEIAGRRSTPVSSLWTESASLFLASDGFSKLDAGGEFPADLSVAGKGNESLAYLPRVSTPHFADIVSNTSSLQILRRFITRFSWFSTAQSLLFTSFYELESEVIDTLRLQIPVPIYTLGTSITHTTLRDSTDAMHPHFEWLDSQPVSSVLYVSMGSFLPISGPQMEEMAIGLRESGVRFLWVSRGDPESRSRGLVVPWCDQLRVLCHPSVGGFLTHCGWNSTLEGVYTGVPMLTFPLVWDQYPNSKMIVDDWKVGLRLKDEEVAERVVGREEITRMVRELMDLDGEESKGLRRRAAELKDKCQKALEEGGSSSIDLGAFVREIIGKKRNIGSEL